ncbi:MAG: alanine--tRNA ligase, partial [Clostridia bacterium]|nr:alanine--tRNA ligase [Clostridia bacterium]
PGCHCGKYNEIWNDVFMQYKIENAGEKAQALENPNIDTGMGVERTICVLNGVKSSYDIGIFKEVIDFMDSKATVKKTDDNVKSYRILADHLRSAIFVLGDEKHIKPSNIGQGYILRRFIRRSVNHARKIGLDTKYFSDVADLYIDYYSYDYDILTENREFIKSELSAEVEKFAKAIDQGYKEFEKVISGIERHKQFAKEGEVVENIISGKASFRLFDTFGFPIELTKELAKELGYEVDMVGFEEANKKHQELSRSASAGAFKGGLADNSYENAKLHTATHIMLAGLRKMFGTGVEQKGSNITPERLRFDFNLDHKMTPEEIKELEDFVNAAIEKKIDVVAEEIEIEKARAEGAYGIFNAKPGDIVKVYTIEGVDKQICGGPHAKNTGDLHHFKITKEESSSSGIRRIKAILD